MQQAVRCLFCLLMGIITSSYILGQFNGSQSAMQIPDQLISLLIKRSASAEQKLTATSRSVLRKFSKLEKRQIRKVKDSGEVYLSGNEVDSIYHHISRQFDQNALEKPVVLYSAVSDSVNTALKFLLTQPDLLNNSRIPVQQVQEALASMERLQVKLGQARSLNNWMAERKSWWLSVSGIKQLNQIRSLQKGAYYFQESVRQYQQVLDDPGIMQQKALQAIAQMPAFRSFMAKNSMLAALFPEPKNMGTPYVLAGLQTREEVQGLVKHVLQSGGPESGDLVKQQLQAAKLVMEQLKQKVANAGGANSDFEVPDFKVNNERKHRFLQRLELGTNIQTSKSMSLLPTTTDLGLSLGYRLNDKSVVGIGAAYKMGWEGNIRHISVSHQGIGLRSYLDYRLKGSFWLSAGAEMNYRSAFEHIAELKSYSRWQQSVLVGLGKKYQISKKFKGNIQLLWDVLSYEQEPKTQSLVFRLGYSFK